MNIIDIKNLRIDFRDSQSRKKAWLNTIRGVDIEIKKEQIIGFVGESGSGKSVVAKTLLNLNTGDRTFAEKVEVNGNSFLSSKTSKFDAILKEKRNGYKFWKNIRGKEVAYIPQDPLNSLNPTMKIGKQIIEAFMTSQKMSRKEAKEKTIALLEEFGLKNAKDLINSYPHEFSGGMQQRVVLAIAIACNPKIIIADEPTTALDPTVQSGVLALLQSINKKYKTTIILISHDIAVVAKMVDYIYVFYAGCVLEKAKTKDLLTNPQHPYTWALLSAMPSEDKSEKLYEIPGTPPEFRNYPQGDPFSPRNEYALKIDFIKKPPLFKYKDDHYAATWLLHPSSPKVEQSQALIKKLNKIKTDVQGGKYEKTAKHNS